MTLYPATTIAFAFVQRGIREGKPVTQMKLQKMMYFAQGIHLAMHHQPLFEDTIQAWKFGPVIPSVYQEYKLYGSEPISDLRWVGNVRAYERLIKLLDSEAVSTIETTWTALKDFDAIALSNWTHIEGSPWAKHYRAGVNDVNIPTRDMERYFERYVVKQDGETV